MLDLCALLPCILGFFPIRVRISEVLGQPPSQSVPSSERVEGAVGWEPAVQLPVQMAPSVPWWLLCECWTGQPVGSLIPPRSISLGALPAFLLTVVLVSSSLSSLEPSRKVSEVTLTAVISQALPPLTFQIYASALSSQRWCPALQLFQNPPVPQEERLTHDPITLLYSPPFQVFPRRVSRAA